MLASVTTRCRGGQPGKAMWVMTQAGYPQLNVPGSEEALMLSGCSRVAEHGWVAPVDVLVVPIQVCCPRRYSPRGE
jgi:hypothetical protein